MLGGAVVLLRSLRLSSTGCPTRLETDIFGCFNRASRSAGRDRQALRGCRQADLPAALFEWSRWVAGVVCVATLVRVLTALWTVAARFPENAGCFPICALQTTPRPVVQATVTQWGQALPVAEPILIILES